MRFWFGPKLAVVITDVIQAEVYHTYTVRNANNHYRLILEDNVLDEIHYERQNVQIYGVVQRARTDIRIW